MTTDMFLLFRRNAILQGNNGFIIPIEDVTLPFDVAAGDVFYSYYAPGSITNPTFTASAAASEIRISRDGNRVVYVSAGASSTFTFDLNDSGVLTLNRMFTGGVGTTCDIHPDPDFFMTGGTGNFHLIYYDRELGDWRSGPTWNVSGTVSRVRFNKDGTRLAVVTTAQVLHIYAFDKAEMTCTLLKSTTILYGIDMHYLDDGRIVTCKADSTYNYTLALYQINYAGVATLVSSKAITSAYILTMSVDLDRSIVYTAGRSSSYEGCYKFYIQGDEFIQRPLYDANQNTYTTVYQISANKELTFGDYSANLYQITDGMNPTARRSPASATGRSSLTTPTIKLSSKNVLVYGMASSPYLRSIKFTKEYTKDASNANIVGQYIAQKSGKTGNTIPCIKINA